MEGRSDIAIKVLIQKFSVSNFQFIWEYNWFKHLVNGDSDWGCEYRFQFFLNCFRETLSKYSDLKSGD